MCNVAVMQAELRNKGKDDLVDLTHMSDAVEGEGYGQGQEERAACGSNPANASLIRRFNQHSTMVLKACNISTTGHSGKYTAVLAISVTCSLSTLTQSVAPVGCMINICQHCLANQVFHFSVFCLLLSVLPWRLTVVVYQLALT